MRTVLTVSSGEEPYDSAPDRRPFSVQKIPAEKAIAERRVRYYNSTVSLDAVIMGVL